jgi:hypothetical protein
METFMKLTIKPLAEKNSKNITHAVYDEKGHVVGSGREADVVSFVQETVRLSSTPLNGEKVQYGNTNPFCCFQIKVRQTIRARSGSLDCYEDLSLLFSPSGDDLDGRGHSACVSKHGSCLTDHYEAPKAVALVDDDMIVRTEMGNFKLAKDAYGYYSAKKID